MDAAILAIGTELTRGELCDTNSCWLSERLTELGVDVIEHATVDDDTARIAAAMMRLGQQVDWVVTTGGLGPTSDDLTTAAATAALGVPLERDPGSVAALEARYRRLGRVMPPGNLVQADFPAGARVLANDAGTAPGFSFRLGRANFYCVPGVPREMRHIVERHLVPDVTARVRRTTHQVHFRCHGLAESEVAERVADFDAGGALARPGITLGYRATMGEIELKVLARAENEPEARRLANDVAGQVRERLGWHVFGGRGDTLAKVVGEELRAVGLTLALAESCTGGLVGKLLTDNPGSSDYLLLSAVTYANGAKTRLLGVEGDLLERHGAVSSEVAAAMAEGALRVSGADLSVALTGIAGPGGGSEEKPVGTVWFGLARPGFRPHTERRQLPADRELVRRFAALHALGMIRATLAGRLTLDPSEP